MSSSSEVAPLLGEANKREVNKVPAGFVPEQVSFCVVLLFDIMCFTYALTVVFRVSSKLCRLCNRSL
jgi:hypothetical protein